MGLLPTKGLTLPLVSYGGSSLLMMGVALGLVLRLDRELSKPQRKLAVRRDRPEQGSASDVAAEGVA